MDTPVVFKKYFYLLSFEFFCLALLTISNQSESGNSFFLGYSLQRLSLIFIALALAIYFSYGTVLSFKNKIIFERYLSQFKRYVFSKLGKIILEIVLILLTIILSFLIWGFLFFTEELDLFYGSLPYIYILLLPYFYFSVLILLQTKLMIAYEEKNTINILGSQKGSIFEIRNKFYPYIILVIFILISGYLKISIYANPKESIATGDTSAYLKSSEIDFFNWDFFTADRPATITAFIKILEPDEGYQILEIANPGINSKNTRIFQPGLDRIVIGQTIISVICWSFLALTLTMYLKNPLFKILGGIIIVSFSIMPQISDWNNVVQSESLSISFFILTLSLTFHWVFRLIKYPESTDIKNIALTLFFTISLLLWVFSRDSNAYFLIGLILFLTVPILIPSFKIKLPIKLLATTIIGMSFIFVFHNNTINMSDRWVHPIMNNIKVQILPYNDRVEKFESYGMPVDEEILSYEYQLLEPSFLKHELFSNWFLNNGLNAYKRFLISTPIHTISLPIVMLTEVFTVDSQPYFVNRSVPDLMVKFGEILNQTTPNILYLEIALLMILLFYVLREPSLDSISMLWILSLFFFNTALMYVVTIHGDSASPARHSSGSIIAWRLFLWMMIIIVCDTGFFNKNKIIPILADKEIKEELLGI